ncbi:MAG: hypothetical protein AB7G48_12345 [Nitrospiraceae bacterium]
MTQPAAPSLSDYRFLMLTVPPIAILLLAVELFEFSANITVDNFLDLTKGLMQPASKSPSREFHATHFLVEVKARYVWLTTVVVALVAGAYAAMMCATLIYQSHPMRRLMVVSTVGLVLSAIGLLFLWWLDNSHALYRAVFGFTYDNLRHAGSQRISEGLLRYTMTVVSVVNVQAIVVPVVALLAACSTLAPPVSGRPADQEHCAVQMRRLKEVLSAGSAILVAGVLHMGAWRRWSATSMRTKPCWARRWPSLCTGASPLPSCR